MKLRMKSVASVSLLALLAITIHAAQASDPAQAALETAKKKEVIDGDLKAAIEQYKTIVSKYKTDRAATAEALIRMADCYQKLGDAQARKIYQQVVQGYRDQNDAVKLAQVRLGATGDATNLRLASVDLKTGRFSSVLIATSRDKIDWQWSPDGKFLAYLSEPPDRENPALFIRTMDSGQTRELQPKPLVLKWLMPWSLDGRTVSVKAVGDFHTGTPEGHYVVDVNTGEASLVMRFDTPYVTQDFEWLPDGHSFLTQIREASGSVQNSSRKTGIYRVDAKTGEMTPLGINARKGYFVPSRDGKKIFYVPPAQGASTLIEHDLTSGSKREMIRGRFEAISLSPNGDYIATTRLEPASNARTVVLIPTRGGKPRDLRVPSEAQREDVSAQDFGGWGPDGQSVFVRKISMDKTKAELWLIPVNGEGPKRLAGDVPVTNFLWSGPDGLHFAYNVPASAR